MTNFKPDKSQRKSEAHLALIRKLPSCLSGSKPCVPHHLLSVRGERGVGQKAADRWTIPLTWEEHQTFHHECTSATEEFWFVSKGVMPHALARDLWNATGDLEAMERVIGKHWMRASRHD